MTQAAAASIPATGAPSRDGDGLGRYESAFREEYAAWSAILQRNAERLARGQYSLHWLDTDKASWGRRAKPSSRGLTYTDVNQVKGYGEQPRHALWRNFAPRGAVRDPYLDEMPVLEEYTVLDRGEVWADNVITLYEEAKARQWNATRDIPWGELEPLPEDLEKATCQLCTFLTEVEFVAL